MKNFFLTLVAFPFFSLLTACGALVGTFEDPYDKSCDLGVGDQTQVWGQVEYLLPECWEVISTYPNLVLEGLSTTMKLSKLPFEGEEANSSTTVEIPNLDLLYIYSTYDPALVPNAADEDVQRIVDSLKRHPFSLASSSCDAPDSTFAESINYEWLNLNFALPFCWGAEEELANGEPFKKDSLTLTRGDGTFWVRIITEESNYDGSPLSPTRTEHENHSTFDYEGYFYVETNAPDEHQVQIILNSIILR